MSRLPIDKQAEKNAPRGQEHYWAVMTKLDEKHEEGFTLDQVYRKTNASKPTVKEFFDRMIKAEFLSVVRSEDDGPMIKRNYYSIAKRSRFAPKVRRDGSICPPSKRDVMWRTMRMSKQFTAKELVIWASLPEIEIKLSDAKDYIKHLVKAGYIMKVGKQVKGIDQTYLFLKNTGPLPLKIQRIKQVFDPNLNKVVWTPEAKA